jgi:dienelactone hydrolase
VSRIAIDIRPLTACVRRRCSVPKAAARGPASSSSWTVPASAAHGWTMKDIPIYNEAAAERHWNEMLTLFDQTLQAA